MTDGIRIDQLLAGFADGDAISNEALIIREALWLMGYDSDIYAPAAYTSPTLQSERRNIEEYQPRSCDICIHHYGIWSGASRIFSGCQARKILVYHNITPAEYFHGFSDEITEQLREARQRLGETAQAADAVWACSEFNAAELKGIGVQNTRLFPVPFSPGLLDGPPDAAVARKLTGPLTNILFVGRLAPNKRLEDLMAAFAWYNKTINPFSRLVIAGSEHGVPAYNAMLRLLVLEMDLANVCFMGFLPAAGLAACYDAADVYVCPSEHEGYCLPLVEAMHKRVPVLARDAGGKPEALGGAGVLYEGLAAEELAALIHLAVEDKGLRREILDSQDKRMKRLLARRIDKELEELLRQFMSA